MPQIQYRFEDVTNRSAEWASEHLGVSEKNIAIMVPLVAAVGTFYMFMMAGDSLNKGLGKLGNTIKQWVEPIPIVGPLLGGAIHSLTGVSNVLLGGAVAVFAFLALQSSKEFTNPLLDPNKQHWLDPVNPIKSYQRYQQSKQNDADTAEVIASAANPDFAHYKNLKYYSVSFETYKRKESPVFRLDFSDNTHLQELSTFIENRKKEQTKIRDDNKGSEWSSDSGWRAWLRIGTTAAGQRMQRYDDAAHEVNALSAAEEELRKFRRELSSRKITSENDARALMNSPPLSNNTPAANLQPSQQLAANQ